MAKIRSIRSKMNFCLLLSLPLILIFFIMILILGLKCFRSRQNRKVHPFPTEDTVAQDHA
ncbi:hypothetical protein YC2023_034051 [Brassica napus]